MGKQTVIIIRTNDGEIAQKSIQNTGKPLIIQATEGVVSYELRDLDSNVAPDQVLLVREGSNLKIYFSSKRKKDEEEEDAALVIEGYYESGEADLIGLAEDGQYYNYVPQEGNENLLVSDMNNGAISYSSLGTLEADSFTEWPVVLGVLALGAGAVALGGSDSTPSPANNPGEVVLEGAPTQGSRLEAMLTDPDGVVGSPVYSWTIDGQVIPDSNQRNLTLGEEHVGKEIFVTATYTDTFGEAIVQSASVTVVDTVAPDNTDGTGINKDDIVLTDDIGDITGPIVDDGFTDDVRPTYSGTAGTGVVEVIIYNDGVEIARSEVTDGVWSFAPTDDLEEGEYNFTVAAVDAAGNIGPATALAVDGDDTFTVDITAPLSDISSLAIESVVDDQGDVTGALVSGDTTDDSKPDFSGIAEAHATVTIIDNGTDVGTTQADENGNWTFTPNTPLLAGDHTITVTATDEAGNTSAPSAPFDFTLIGAAAPAAPSIVSVIDDVDPITGNIAKDTGVTNDTEPTFNGTAEAGATVKLYDGATLIGEVVADSSGNWSMNSTTLSEGAHHIVATATNVAGNVSPQTGAYSFTVDTTAPNVVGTAGTSFELLDDVAPVIGSISDGSTTDDATPTISGTGEPGTTIQAYDGEVEIGSPAVVQSNGTWTIALSTPLSEGAHAISVTATDVAGNGSAKSNPITFTVDTSSVSTPIITNYSDDISPVTGEFGSGSTTNDTIPTFSGTAQNGTTVQLYINGVATGNPVAITNGTWSIDAQLPSEGTHSVVAVSTNAAGANTSSSPFIVTLDTQAPGTGGTGAPVITDIVDDVGSIQGSMSSGKSSDDTTPTIKGTAEPFSLITISDTVGGVLGTTYTDGNGNWTFTPATALSNGTHTFSVTATDAAGNESTPSNDYTLIIDTIAPSSDASSLAIESVIDDQGDVTGQLVDGATTDDSKPDFSGIAEANATVTIIDNGTAIGTTQADENGDWTFTPETPLLAGDHSITITATDEAGNTSDESVPFTFELIGAAAPVAPAIISVLDNVGTITTPIAKDSSTDDTTPTFNGTAEAGAKVRLYEEGTLLGETVADSQGEWTITTTTLVDGEHAIYATATNAAGNVSPQTGEYTLSVDTLAPNSPIINVVEADDIINAVEKSDGVVISGTAEASSLVKLYDGSTFLTEVMADQSGNWSVSFSSSQVPVDGTRDVRATATDEAGNVSTATVRSVTIETVAPNAPTINTIEGNDIINALEKSDGVVISGTAEAGTTVKLTYNGSDLGETAVDASGNWSFSFDASEVPADGFATVVATATDAAGNRSPSSSKTVLIDTTAPEVPTLVAFDDVDGDTGAISTNSITNDAFPTLSGTGENGSTITIYDGELSIGETTVVNGTWSLELSTPLSNDLHGLMAVSTDAAGNSSESTVVSFTVDNSTVAAPTISNYYDDIPVYTGNFGSGSSTNDTLPTFSGSTPAGTTVEVFVDGVSIGQATVENGTWSLTPSTPLSEGDHTVYIVATNIASSTSQSTDFVFSVDTTTPNAPVINDIETDNVINGIEKSDGVTISGTAEANATVKLYNDTVYLGEVLADSNGDWSVSFGAAQVPADGTYRVTATATDSVGNVSDETEKIVLIDTLAPLQPTIHTIEGDNIINAVEKSDGVVISGTAEAGSSVAVDFGGVVKTVVATGGVWSVSYTDAEVPVDGEYVVSVTSIDSAGNVSIPATQAVTIDTAAPSGAGAPVITDIIDDVGSIQGSTLSGSQSDDTTPTLRGTAEANTTINIYDGNNLLGVTTATASGTWSFTPTTALDNGLHVFNVTATDTAGNLSDISNTYSLIIDTIAPATPTGPMSYEDNVGDIRNTESTAPTTDDTTPGVNVGTGIADTLTLYVNDVAVAADYDASRGTLTPVTPLIDGETYTLTYTLTDAAGNESGKSPELVLTIDTTAPSKPSAPTTYEDNIGPVINEASSAPVTDDATPGINIGSGLVDIPTLYVDGVEVSATYDSISGTLTPDTPVEDGTHSFTYTLTDAAGNQSEQSDALGITIDTSIPSVPIITTLSDDMPEIVGNFTSGVITNDTTPVINGTTAADTIVHIYDNGILSGEAVVSGTTWSFDMSGLDDGSNHTITATATNAAGTISEVSDAFSFLIDTTAPGEGGSEGMPVITGVEDNVGPLMGTVENNGYTNDTTPTLTGTAEAGSIIKVYDGLTLLGQTTANGSGLWSYTHTDASEGTTYAYYATATDQAGNVSGNSNTYSVTIDTISPSSDPSDLAITSILDDQGAVQGEINIIDAVEDITDDAKPTLGGIAEAGSMVTIYDNGTAIGTTTATPGGTWIFTPETPLLSGDHSFTITATDSAGNISGESAPAIGLEIIGSGAPAAPVIVNAIDDVGSITGNIAKDTGITNDTEPEIRGTSEAGAVVTLYADGNSPADIVATVTADELGNWSVNTSTLSQGVHVITATATNGAGNISAPTGPYSFTVDTSAIAPAFILVDNSGTPISVGTDDPTPTLVGAAGSGESGATVIAYDDTDSVIGTTVAASDGSWSITPTVSLTDGTHTISATQTDVAGNTSLPSAGTTFVLITNLDVPVINTLSDNVDPLTGDFSSGIHTNDTQPTLNGTAPANALVTIYEGNSTTVLGTVTADGSGNWSLELSSALSEGAHSLTATATVLSIESDRSGAFDLTIDTSAPSGSDAPVITVVTDDVGSIQGNVDDGGVTDDITPTLVGTAEADSLISIYDTVGGLLGNTTADHSGDWRFTPATALHDTAHTFYVIATDVAGNVSDNSDTYTVTIDVTPPTLTVDAPDNMYDTTPTITGTTDAIDGTEVSLIVIQGADTQTFTATVSGGIYSVDLSNALLEGDYTVSAAVSDAAGNANTATDTGSVQINEAPVALDDTNLVANDAPMSIYSGLFRFYDTMLGREPDMGGYNYYITNLVDGTLTPEQVAQGFLDSAEGNFAAMSDAEFVTALVSNAYDRSPTAQEQSDFEAELAAMGRLEFAMMISESEESILVHSDPFYEFAVLNSPQNPDTLPSDEVFVSAEDNEVTIPVNRLLANDSDADGDVLSVISVQDAFGGTVSLSDGLITFVPLANYYGTASFTYTISDGQGGEATATVSWSIAAVNDAPTIVFTDMNGAVEGEITVDEAAMPSGNNSSSSAESTSGTFTLSDIEGLTSITINGSVVTEADVGNGTQYAVSNGYMTIDSFDTATGIVHYTYTLTSGADGDSAVIPVEIVVTDSDGLSTTGTLNVRVLDDAPVISSSELTFVPSQINTNLMVTLDLSGSMAWTPNDGQVPNSTGEVTNLELAKQALFNLISKYDTLGDVKVMLVVFGDSAGSLSAWVTPNEAKQIMAMLEANWGGTNYNTALSQAMNAFGRAGKLEGDDVQNVSYFLSDGVPTTGGNANYVTDTGSTWTNFLSTNDILSHAIGINATAMNNIAYDGITDTNIDATQINSLADLDNTLATTVPLQPLVGNISGSFSSTYGGDGGYVKEFVADGVTYTYDPNGNGGNGVVTRSNTSNTSYSFNDTTNTISFITSQGSSVSVNMDSGEATFAAPAIVSEAYSEVFNYTTSDMDGDTASSSATINVPQTASAIEVNLIGGYGNQALTGGSSNDLLQGSSGNDTLIGNGGDDILIGGAGYDTLTGGTGEDIFIFSAIDGSSNGGVGLDTLTDFTTNADAIFDTGEDILDLSGFFSYWGENVNESNVEDYININGTSIQIDRDGPNWWGSNSWTTIATLSGTSDTFTNEDLSSMVAAGQIVL